MEEIKLQPVHQITHSIAIILRYFASGFIAVITYLFLYQQKIDEFAAWPLFFITVSIGFLTYAFHIAFMDKVFYTISSQWMYWRYGDKPVCKGVKDAMKEVNTNLELKEWCPELLHFALATQAYLRNISEDPQLLLLQKELERRLSLLCFIYCSCYQIAIILLYFFFVTRFDPSFYVSTLHWANFLVLTFGGAILTLCAIAFNNRIFLRDFWVTTTFYQHTPIKKEPVVENEAPLVLKVILKSED